MKNFVARFLFLLMPAYLVWPGSCKRLKDKVGLRGGDHGSLNAMPSKAILEELEDELGTEHRQATEQRLRGIEKELLTTFKALPKNSRGAVEAPSARYALHRLFLQRYGWQIKGLEPENGVWDVASPIQAMGDRVPLKMRELFEHRLDNFGLSLHELAVVAVTMEGMIRSDVQARLKIVYGAWGWNETKLLSWSQADEVTRSYVSIFLLGGRTETISRSDVPLNRYKYHPNRFERYEGIEGLRLDIIKRAVPDYLSNNFSFDLISSLMGSFGEQLGSFEDKECKRMKRALMKMEHRPGSGRVRLGNFYDDSELGHFTEESDFLRKAGVLDESNPEDPLVIIPNYLASPSNCVSPSGYYEICCFDGCENLMDKIEAKLEAPIGTPEAIASMVTSLKYPAAPSTATLPAGLMDLLHKVASNHEGSVPIHGRLFWQWMHQAFPHECAQPLVTMDRYSLHRKRIREASDEEKSKFAEVVQMQELAQGSGARTEEHIPCSTWTSDEQLVDSKAYKSQRKWRGMRDALSIVAITFLGMATTKLLFGYGDRRLKTEKLPEKLL